MNRSKAWAAVLLLLLAGCRGAEPALEARIVDLEADNERPRSKLTTYETVLTQWPSTYLEARMPQVSAAVTEVVSDDCVVIDRGHADGVWVGWTFQVYRGREYKGRIQVLHVMEDRSACVVVRLYEGRSITVGDTAATHL